MLSGSGRSSTRISTNRPRRPSVYLTAGLILLSLTRAVAQPPEAVEPDQAIHDRAGARRDHAADQGREDLRGEARETEADGHPEAGGQHGHHDTVRTGLVRGAELLGEQPQREDQR